MEPGKREGDDVASLHKQQDGKLETKTAISEVKTPGSGSAHQMNTRTAKNICGWQHLLTEL
jgi:hypothetical protein